MAVLGATFLDFRFLLVAHTQVKSLSAVADILVLSLAV